MRPDRLHLSNSISKEDQRDKVDELVNLVINRRTLAFGYSSIRVDRIRSVGISSRGRFTRESEGTCKKVKAIIEHKI